MSIFARLRAVGLYPPRGRDQHYLCDPRLLAGIVEAADVQPHEAVLEVGTGPGTLTRHLGERAGRVVSVEIDPAVAEFARNELEDFDNVQILTTDVLSGKSRVAPTVLESLEASPRWKLVANLPYSIATPLLLNLFEQVPTLSLGVVTVQLEVAERLCAESGDVPYGPASVLLGYWCEVRPVRDLPPGAFRPPPKVASRLIRIQRLRNPLGAPQEYPAFAGWVSELFGQRRKQIGGLLRRKLGAESGAEALKLIGVQGSERAEALSAASFLSLARSCARGSQEQRGR